MQLFGTDLLKTYWAHDVEMTSMRRNDVASTSFRRHVPAGSLPPPWPPNILDLGPPNILNLLTPMKIKFRVLYRKTCKSIITIFHVYNFFSIFVILY